MSFENLELKNAECFGWKRPSKDEDGTPGWVDIARELQEVGWGDESADAKAELQRNLSDDVTKSYYNVCRFTVKDLDTGMSWDLKFVNDKALWRLTVHGGGDAQPLDDDYDGFFKSDLFRQIADSTSDNLRRAKKVYSDAVDERVENGELLDVDEVKLSALMFWIDSKEFVDNLLSGKHSK